MVSTIDMKDLMNLNLFAKITGIQTRFCLKYNETIFFCVPKNLVSKAIGPEARNVKKINSIIRKRVKIIACPRGIEDAKKFVESIVSPVTFKDLEVKNDEIILTAGSQSKAALLGRNKRRLIEMKTIIKDFFKKELEIV